MSAPEHDTSGLESRLTAELHDAAAGVHAPVDGRARIDARIRARGRRRRTLAAVTSVLVVATAVVAAVRLVPGGDEGAEVLTRPGPSPQTLPRLAPADDQWWLTDYRSDAYTVTFVADGRVYDLSVFTSEAASTTAARLPDDVEDAWGTMSFSWSPAVGAVAELLLLGRIEQVTAGISLPAGGAGEDVSERLAAVASSLQDVDDERWWAALMPKRGAQGPPRSESSAHPHGPAPRLTVPPDQGLARIRVFSPWHFVATDLELPGFERDTFRLEVSGRVAPEMWVPPADRQVRGVAAVVIDADSSHRANDLGVAVNQLAWLEDGWAMTLSFTDDATVEDAVAVAESLRWAGDDEWRQVIGGVHEGMRGGDGDPPAAPEYDGPGRDHPFVGRTERDIFLRYALVRVVWRDGEFFVLTGDLRPGRVNLAVADGIVVAAEVEGCFEYVEVPACDPSPDDGPDLSGVVLEPPDDFPGEPANRVLVRVEPATPDRTGTMWLIGLENAAVRNEEGTPLDRRALTPGTRVDAWLAGGCLDPDPGLCGVSAVVVRG
jgi:hypothetical protein